MSRTTRRRPHGFNPGEALHERTKRVYAGEEEGYIYRGKYGFAKDDIYHNRDAKPFGTGKRGAYKGGPKGYSSWDTVPDGCRRDASRAAAKILRRRGKDDIRQDLLAD